MQKTKFEQCHLCGEITKLTHEHVPPQKAFNAHQVFLYWGKDIIGREKFPWDFSGLKGKQHQGGVGWRTLCAKCNNDTGGWYAPAFIEFTYQGFKRYKELLDNKRLINKGQFEISFGKIYPLEL